MDNDKKGLLFVISGPSGVGKGTICKKLLERRKELKLSVSVTTRAPRPGEIEGVNYFFRSEEQFQDMIARDEFLEYMCVFGKNHYGTPSKGFIEFNNPDSHKGAGLEWVAGYLGIAQKDTVAVGDNSLDLEMIRWAGLGCAVDNGKPEVKEAADLVIPSCADFGVARLIECIINGKV